MPLIQLRVLGGLDLSDSEGRDLRGILAQPKRFAFLAFLAVATPRGYHRRDTLLALFWPELDTDHARNALRQAVHFLRTALGPGVVLGRGTDELGIDPQHLWCDAAAFDETHERGDLEAALELYRGDLLPGFFVTEAPDLEQRLDEERVRLRERAVRVAWRLVARAEAAGEPAVAVHWARWGVRRSPHDEAGLRRLMELCARTGDRAGAVRAYEEFADRLARELDTAPSQETQVLVSRLREPPAPERLGRRAAEPERPTPAGPIVAPPTTPPHARPVWARPVSWAGAAALALLAVAAWPGRPGPAPEAVAVFPFGVRGDAELAYLREGMVDLLSTKLEGAVGLRSIDPRAVLAAARPDDAAPRPRAAAALARWLGAGWFVVGDVVEIAGRVHLSGALYSVRTDADPVAKGSVEGESAKLFELVDELAGQLLAGRGEGRDPALTRIAALTTQSLPALKAFLEGERAFRAGHDVRAIESFEEAVALDSTFSLAHYRLAIAGRWAIGATISAEESAASAVRHAERLSPLARDLVGAYRAYLDLRADEAEVAYRRITQSHPDNLEAWFMLGETWFHFNGLRGRPFTEARAAFERVLELDPADPHALIHLARLAAAEGNGPEIDSLASRFLARHPDAERALEMRVLRAYTVGDRAEQAALAVPPPTAHPLARYAVLDAVATYAQDLGGALELAPAYAVTSPSFIEWYRILTTQILLAKGIRNRSATDLSPRLVDADWALQTRALVAADPLFSIGRSEVMALRDSVRRRASFAVKGRSQVPITPGPQPAVRAYLLGLLSTRLGDAGAAARYAAELEALSDAPGDSGVGRDLAHTVRAAIARAHGAPQAALAELDRFRFDPGTATHRRMALAGAYERFLRAELLHALGHDAEALQWYGSFPAGFDLRYLAPAHLRQGEIRERLGQRERAIAHYRRFVEMWRDCDPELRPMVAEAERALARLRATR